MKHVCRRCLTAFSSQPVLMDHIDRCQKQKPTNFTFSYKNHLKFEDYHMRVSVPVRVYADFECINQPQNDPNVLSKQIPIAVGINLITPSGNKYYSYFGTDCVKWFVKEMLTLEHEANKCFKINIPPKMTPEEEVQFQQSTICWLCEGSFLGCDEKNRDHDHLTGKYREAAHSKCNINVRQKQSCSVHFFFHNFSGSDCYLIFELLLTEAFVLKLDIKILPKYLEIYVSVQVGCLGFLDSHRFLSSGLGKLVKRLDTFSVMQENGLEDEIIKKKLGYPYE